MNRWKKGADVLIAGLGFALAAGRAEAWVSAKGGTVTYYTDAGGTNWTAHSFTTVGTNSLNVTVGGEVDVLVVGGGGGGGKGYYGGGGGGGGLIYSNVYPVVAGSNYAVIVGSGGVGASSYTAQGGSGSDSKFDTSLVAKGGGGGGSRNNAASGGAANGANGGSGGGIGVVDSTRGLATQPALGGFGNDGAPTAGRQSNSYGCGGGGAGAAAPDTAINSGETYSLGGVGGNGKAYDLAGTNQYYAGGGGGGACATSDTRSPASTAGGLGGGGRGGRITDYSPDPGMNGLGGGGGGGGNNTDNGANGGSGIVIVRYLADTTRPVIQNQPVTSVTTASATFNGLLTSTGSSACAVCVYWGTDPNAWANTNWFNGGAVNSSWTNNTPFSTNIASGINADATYYYSFGASNATTNGVAEGPKDFITGLVTVEATTNTAQYPSNGVFTIARPATCTNEAIVVPYTIGGTAVSNLNYSLSSWGSVTLAAGQAGQTVTVTPLGPLPGTVVLTLDAGANYPTGAMNSATVTILEGSYSPAKYVALTGSDGNGGTSWGDAYQTLTKALANVSGAIRAGASNAQVYVDTGVYTQAVELVVTQAIAIIGKGGVGVAESAQTVVRQAGSFRVFTLSHTNARLDGLVVENGYMGQGGDGGNVYMGAGLVTNCVIRNNRYSLTTEGGAGWSGMQRGGGVHMTGGLVANSVISGNGIGHYVWGYGYDNYSYGGGVYISGGTLRRSMVTNNHIRVHVAGYGRAAYGAGVYMAGAKAVVENCLIQGNRGYNSSELGNATWRGAGVYLNAGTLRNCTVVTNTQTVTAGTSYGGGVLQAGGGMTNCIVWGNTANNDTNYSGSGQSVTYSLAPELTSGDGNITADPLFVGAPAGNYRLTANSPAVNAGTNQPAWMATATDLDGNLRILGGRVDMGAYESAPPQGTVITIR